MIEKPLHVRPARPSDEDALFNMLCLAYSENALYKMSAKKVRDMIEQGTRSRDVIIGVAESPDGKIAGSIGAYFMQWWFSDEWSICELWNFVHPDHRKSPIRYGVELIQYGKWLAENMKMPLHMGILTATRMEAKVKMYKRQLNQSGAIFIYNAGSASGPLAHSNLAEALV